MSLNLDDKKLSHVIWIGGAPDSGKTTIAQKLANRYNIDVYSYDQFDAIHHHLLAETVPEIQQFINATLNERWINPDPNALFNWLRFSFAKRFPLVVEQLLEYPSDFPMIAEGFGILPELIQPLLSNYHQAIWLVPTEDFKRASWCRRGKPSFVDLTSDPQKAKLNVFTRDMLLANYYRDQVLAYDYKLIEIDGSQTVEEVTKIVDDHFVEYLSMIRLA